jgi:hypothetical protein
MAYSDFQQTFALSMASNLAMDTSGSALTLQQLLSQRIATLLADPLITANMPGWEVVWGPQVWQAPLSDKCDQAMVVFRNGVTDVVAIAATNSASWYDWLIEDANVARKQPVAWPGAPAQTWISDGTLVGINRLLGMSFPPSHGMSLADFLRASPGPNKDRTLIITGHSLAGALSPTLALVLFTREQLDRSAWRVVKVYPTAGYSPGNANFAVFFAQQFPAQQTAGATRPEVWNKLIWNTFDVVPRAWDRATLTGLTSLYGTQLEPLDRAEIFAVEFTAHELSGPDYKQVQSSPLSYHVTHPVTSVDEFLQQMSYQHVEAYFYLLGVADLLKFMPGAGNPPPPPPPRASPKRARLQAIAKDMATDLS